MHLKPEKTKAPAAHADEIAVSILSWLGNEPDLFNRFLSLSGLDLSDLRAFSRSPAFNVALMEFIMAHEPTLMAFCAHSGYAPETVSAAWQRLAGPQYGGTGA